MLNFPAHFGSTLVPTLQRSVTYLWECSGCLLISGLQVPASPWVHHSVRLLKLNCLTWVQLTILLLITRTEAIDSSLAERRYERELQTFSHGLCCSIVWLWLTSQGLLIPPLAWPGLLLNERLKDGMSPSVLFCYFTKWRIKHNWGLALCGPAHCSSCWPVLVLVYV